MITLIDIVFVFKVIDYKGSDKETKPHSWFD